MTILAVDDEPLICRLVATVLKDNGYAVLTADSAAAAMALFREHSEEIELLISDIVMPGMNGLALAAELQMQRPDLKVLLISGYYDTEQLSDGYEFLAKPFSLPEILVKVRAMEHAHRSAAPAVQPCRAAAATATVRTPPSSR